MIPAAILVVVIAVTLAVFLGVWFADHRSLVGRIEKMEHAHNEHILKCRAFVRETVVEEVDDVMREAAKRRPTHA
jgi:hypothetical protein